MGRELRRVPSTWRHPKKNGEFIPLFDGKKFKERLRNWKEHKRMWNKGYKDDYMGGWIKKEDDLLHYSSFAEWYGPKPKRCDYMPEWKESELTHIQLYETTTEGTPISPVFHASRLDALCAYAMDHATTFADFKASKEEWKQMLVNDNVHHKSGKLIFV